MSEQVHFIGIGGAGMSGLARVLAAQGVRVAGSDIRETPTVQILRQRDGIAVTVPHDPASLGAATLVVVSAAVKPSNVEYQAAVERDIPIISRAEMLGRLMAKYTRSIGVTGTHGKTTTTGMLATILGLGDLDPTVLIGGDLPEYQGNARLGRSDLFLTEACEAYDSFLSLMPLLAVITNIEADHLDYYIDFEHVLASFRKFLSQVTGTAVLCGDDINQRTLIAEGLRPAVLTYGFEDRNELQARSLQLEGLKPSYTVVHAGSELGKIVLSVPGKHNILNSLGAVGVSLVLGIPFAQIAAGLEAFTGTGRRFERLGETANGVLVVDDYAHHPTEIRATLAAARNAYPDRRLIAVFQPHLPSRTRDFEEDFAGSFADADHVVLADIYLAREQPIEGVTGEKLAARTAAKRGQERVTFIADKAEIARALAALASPGDLVITLGAGDINGVAVEFLRRGGNIEKNTL